MKQITYLSTILLLLLVNVSLTAQQYKFGKVSKDELLETINPADTSANATILYRSVDISYEYSESEGFEVVTEIFERIKFYNKRGFQYATDQIYLYHKGGVKEEVGNIKGATYTIENGSIVETKLKKESIFRNEYSENLDLVKFTMPALKEGAVIEYKYKTRSPFLGNIDKIDLQYNIPIKKLSMHAVIPEYFHFKPRQIGHLLIDLKQSKKNGEITFSQKSRNVGTNTNYSQNKIDFISYQYNIDKENIPAFKKEPYSGNIKNYISGILFELEYTDFPNSPRNSYSTTWEAVINKAYNDSRFGGELKKHKYFQEDVDNLMQGVSDPIEKMNIVYNYLKNKMVWNELHRLMPQKTLKKAYFEKVGNSAEINLLLIAMLDYVGIRVNPVLVTTNQKPLSLFPTLEGFNYVIARVRIDDNIMFLDATDKYGMPNVLPTRVIQGSGRLINDQGNSELVFFRPSKISKQKFKMMCELNENGEITGKQRNVYTFKEAHDFRTQNASLSIESNSQRLNKKYQLSSISDYELKNCQELGNPVQEVFSFEASDEVEVIDNEMFFSPMLFLRKKENIFKSEERAYPVDYVYGFSEEFFITLKIPNGFEVTSIPDDVAFALPDNLGKFIYKSTFNNGLIQIVVNTTLNDGVIAPQYYSYLKQFYNQIVEKENESVVLKKT